MGDHQVMVSGDCPCGKPSLRLKRTGEHLACCSHPPPPPSSPLRTSTSSHVLSHLSPRLCCSRRCPGSDHRYSVSMLPRSPPWLHFTTHVTHLCLSHSVLQSCNASLLRSAMWLRTRPSSLGGFSVVNGHNFCSSGSQHHPRWSAFRRPSPGLGPKEFEPIHLGG